MTQSAIRARVISSLWPAPSTTPAVLRWLQALLVPPLIALLTPGALFAGALLAGRFVLWVLAVVAPGPTRWLIEVFSTYGLRAAIWLGALGAGAWLGARFGTLAVLGYASALAAVFHRALGFPGTWTWLICFTLAGVLASLADDRV